MRRGVPRKRRVAAGERPLGSNPGEDWVPRLSWDSALVSSPFWADPGFGKDNSWAGGVNGNNTGIANARFAVTARAPCRNCVPPPKDIENPASAGGFSPAAGHRVPGGTATVTAFGGRPALAIRLLACNGYRARQVRRGAGGSARTPAKPWGGQVFRGSTERLPRLPPRLTGGGSPSSCLGAFVQAQSRSLRGRSSALQ